MTSTEPQQAGHGTGGERFCQATDMVFITNEEENTGVCHTPEEGINQVRIEPTEILSRSVWKFNDPLNQDKQYVAVFPLADLSSMKDGFTAKARGKLFHLDTREPPGHMSSAIVHDGRRATMLVAGNDGKCNGVFAFVEYTDG